MYDAQALRTRANKYGTDITALGGLEATLRDASGTFVLCGAPVQRK